MPLLNLVIASLMVFFVVVPPGLCIGRLALLRRRLSVARGARGERCPACGYLRAGLAEDAPCPECGRAMAEAWGVLPPAGSKDWLIAGVVGLLVGAAPVWIIVYYFALSASNFLYFIVLPVPMIIGQFGLVAFATRPVIGTPRLYVRRYLWRRARRGAIIGVCGTQAFIWAIIIYGDPSVVISYQSSLFFLNVWLVGYGVMAGIGLAVFFGVSAGVKRLPRRLRLGAGAEAIGV